jgi:hypothetical protein
MVRVRYACVLERTWVRVVGCGVYSFTYVCGVLSRTFLGYYLLFPHYTAHYTIQQPPHVHVNFGSGPFVDELYGRGHTHQEQQQPQVSFCA